MNLLHARRRQELERVLDHRHVHQRHQRLWDLVRDRPKGLREGIGEDDGLEHRLLGEVAIRLLDHCW